MKCGHLNSFVDKNFNSKPVQQWETAATHTVYSNIPERGKNGKYFTYRKQKLA